MNLNLSLLITIVFTILHAVDPLPTQNQTTPSKLLLAPPISQKQILQPPKPTPPTKVYTNGLPITNLQPDYENDPRTAGNYNHYNFEPPIEMSRHLEPPPVLQMRILPPIGPFGGISENAPFSEELQNVSEELQNLEDSPKSEKLESPESLSLAEWENYNIREPNGPGTYAWGYDIEDPSTGNVQFRSEEKHANGTITGSYGYLEPDGLVRITHYVADSLGYRVTQEVGKYKVGPAETSPEFTAALDSLENLQELGPNYSVQDQYLRPINNPKYTGKYNYYFIPT